LEENLALERMENQKKSEQLRKELLETSKKLHQQIQSKQNEIDEKNNQFVNLELKEYEMSLRVE
jgi:hypothetical protein